MVSVSLVCPSRVKKTVSMPIFVVFCTYNFFGGLGSVHGHAKTALHACDAFVPANDFPCEVISATRWLIGWLRRQSTIN